MGSTRFVSFPGPAGRIEAIVQGEPAGQEGPPSAPRSDAGEEPSPRRLAVVCHPHPLGGGSMHTKVVHRTARALQEAGHCVLRFNFRGVGASEGVHDGGTGEQEDLRAAMGWLLGQHPGLPLTVAGFSFGSWVGLRVGCVEPAVDALIGIAVPAGLYDFGFLRACAKPRLFVHGTADDLAPLAAFEEIYRELPEPRRLVRLRGGTHMLIDQLDDLETAVREFSAGLPPAGA